MNKNYGFEGSFWDVMLCFEIFEKLFCVSRAKKLEYCVKGLQRTVQVKLPCGHSEDLSYFYFPNDPSVKASQTVWFVSSKSTKFPFCWRNMNDFSSSWKERKHIMYFRKGCTYISMWCVILNRLQMMRWPQSLSDGEPVVCGCVCCPAVDVYDGVPHHAPGHVRSLTGDDRNVHQDSGQNPRGRFCIFSFVWGWRLSAAACNERSSESSCARSGPQYASRENDRSSLMCPPFCQQVILT